MRRVCLFLVWLVVPTTVLAQDKQDKPILVLNAGGHTASIGAVMFTPDGLQLISVGGDHSVRCWNVRSGELLQVLRPPIIPSKGYFPSGALSPDGGTLAVSRPGPQEGDHWIYLILRESGK